MALPYDESGRNINQQGIRERMKKVAEYYAEEKARIYLQDDPVHGLTARERESRKQEYLEKQKKYFQHTVALAEWNRINNFQTSASSSRVLLSYNGLRSARQRVQYPELERQVAQVYQRAGTKLFRGTTINDQKGSQFFGSKEESADLRYQRSDTPQIMQSTEDMAAAYKNIKKQGEFVYWDTETFSGNNRYGQMQTDALTEFNFRIVSRKSDGTWDLDKSTDRTRIHKSVIGSSQREYDKSMNLIAKYRAGDKTLSEGERVQIQRLALTGHEKTTYEIGKDGVINFKTFAGKEDIRSNVARLAEAGAHRMREFGIAQETAPLVDYNGFRMKGWEREMLSGLKPILEQGVTAVGYNTAGFDWPTLATFLKRADTTDGFKAALKKMTGGSNSVLPKHQLDTLAALRNANINRRDLYTDEEWSELSKDGLTSLQQEALTFRHGGRAAHDKIYAGLEAHMADTDTYVGAHLLINSDMIDLIDLPEQEARAGKAIALKGGDQQLFMSSTGRHVSGFGLWGFRKDNFTGEYRTADGYAISRTDDGETKVRKEIMDQWLFKKEATYSISSIKKFNEDDEFGNLLGDINPDWNKNGLYSVTFNPVVNKGQETIMSQSPITIVGSKDKLQQYISSTMYHVADKDAQGEWQLADDEKMRRDLGVVAIDETDSDDVVEAFTKNTEKDKKAQLQYILNNATLRMKYESAARDSREFSYKKDTGIMSYLNDRNAYATDSKGNFSEKKAREFDKMVNENSRKLEKKLLNMKPGDTISDADKDLTYHSYFGYTDFSDKNRPNVFSETISKQLARIEQVGKNRYFYETAMRHARIRTGLTAAPEKLVQGQNSYMEDVPNSKRTVVESYYKHYLQAMENAAIEKHGEHIARNMQNLGAYRYTKDGFEVNLKGYRGIEEDKFVRFNLNSSGLGYANQIYRALGIDPDIRHYSDHDKTGELKNFQQWFLAQGRVQGVDGTVNDKPIYERIKSTHSSEEAAQILVSNFKTARAANSYAGMSKDTYRYNITSGLMDQGVLSVADVDEIAKKADTTIPEIMIKRGDDLKQHAQNISDKILFGGQSEKEVRKTLSKAGYNKEQIDLQMMARRQRYADTVDFMTDYLSASLKAGADIGYDESAGKVWFAYQGKTLMLDKFLPKDSFENGMFFTELGKTKTATPIGLYDVNGKLQYSSLIRKAAPSRGFMQSVIRRGLEGSDLLGQLEYLGKKFAGTLRESASVAGLDAQDRKAGMYFNFADVIQHLNEIGLDDFSTGNEAIDSILNELIHRDRSEDMPTGDTVTTAQRIAVNEERQKILKTAIAAVNAPKDVQEQVGKLQFSTKHAGEFVATMDPMLDAFESLTSTKRGIHNQASRAIHFNLDLAKQYLSGDDVRFGQIISSAARSYASTNLTSDVGYEVETAARINRLAMSTKDVRRVVNDYVAESDANPYVVDLLSSIHTDEGAGAFDPKVADRLFSYRTSMQKVSYDNVYSRNPGIGNVIENLSRRDVNIIDNEAAAAFRFIQDGDHLKVQYGMGRYVEAGSAFLLKAASDNEDEPSAIIAKESGVLRLGVFSKDGKHLATEQAIAEAIKSVQVRPNATEEELQRAKETAMDILQKKFDISYYIKGANAATNLKLAEMGVEKGMMRSMAASIGSIDKRVNDFLDDVGLSHIKGRVLDIEYLDSLQSARPFEETMFGQFAMHESGYSAGKIEQSIAKHFGTVSAFHDALVEERYKPWQVLQEGLKAAGLQNNGEKVHMISNAFKAEKKHQDAKALFNRVANALMDKYDDDVTKVKDIMSKSVSGLEIRDGHIVISNDDYQASLGALKEISDSLGTTRRAGKDGIEADFARTDVELEPNVDRGRIYVSGGSMQKAIKLNHRAQAILGSQRMSDNRKQRIQKALTSSLGEERGNEIYQNYIDPYKEGDVVSSAAQQFIKDNIYTRPGDEMDPMLEGAAEHNKAHIATMDGGNIHISDEMREGLAQDGIKDEKIVNSIVATAADRGARKISRRIIEERYAAQSSAQAMRFNKKGGGTEDMANAVLEKSPDMQRLSIEEVTMPKNGKSAVEFMDAPYGKEIMLDTHLSFMDDQIYSTSTGEGRFVYVPYAPPKVMPNGELALTSSQKTLGRIHNLVQRHQEDIAAGRASSSDKEEFMTQYKSAIDQLQQDIRVDLTSKTGYLANLSRAHIEDSGLFTAYGNSLFGGEKSQFFSQLNFQGINLSEQAKKAGLDFDYTILSREAMHDFYDTKADEIFQSLGIQGDKTQFKRGLYDRLSTDGTLALNIREPQGYAKSTSISATYFSDVVRGDEAIVGAVQHNSKKGDYDSDKVEAALLKARAVITGDNGNTIEREIDYAMFNQLQLAAQSKGSGITSVSWANEDEAAKMENHIASLYVNAESNKLWRVKNNMLLDNVDSFSGQHLANYTVEGRAGGTLASRMHVTDPDEINALRGRYNTLEAAARQKYGDAFDTVTAEEDKIGIGKEAHQRSMIVQMLEGDSKGIQADDWKAMRFHLSEKLNAMEATTDSLKLGAGEMNYNLFGYLKVAQEADGLDKDDFAKVMQVHTALGEAFLSPKNETGLDPKQIDKLGDAMRNAYKAMQGRYDREQAATEFADVIKDTLHSCLGKEMSALPGVLDEENWATMESGDKAATNKMLTSLTDDAIETYTKKVIMTTNLRGTDPKMLDIGVTKGLTNENRNLEADMKSSDMLQETMQDINKQAKLQDVEAPVAESRGIRSIKYTPNEAPTPSTKLLSDRGEMKLDSDDIHINATSMGKDLANALEHMHLPKSGAAGAIAAVAGGLLVSGYASNPTQPAPAATQADGAQQEYADMYSEAEVPSFSDTGMNTMRGGPKQGYVINISARTEDGRQHAVDAINSVIGSAVPAASSINVAMNTSYQDKISQFQIDKMVQNAF